MKEKRSRYAILGILSTQPMSGYDIKKVFERSVGSFWNESYGQIYPLLRALLGEGLVTNSVERQAGKPDRHIYSLTEKGRDELRRWLTEPVKDQVGRVEIALKLFFGNHVSIDDNLRQIERYREMRSQELSALRATRERLGVEQADNPGLPFILATVSYGEHVNQALIDWCHETQLLLKGLEATERRGKDEAPGQRRQAPRPCKAPNPGTRR